MSDPRGLAGASRSQRDQLLGLPERFEQAWRKSDDVNLADYLPPSTVGDRTAALRELIRIDLKQRWQRGRGLALEDYLGRFPELAKDQATLAQLLFEEYCARQRHGDQTPLAAYQARFPQLHDEFARLVQ